MYSTAVVEQFLEAFGHLPRNIQGRVLDFIEKFQKDPRSSGINYEPIVGARDKKLHSVRIDGNYRAIVLKPKHGNVYRLVWVAKHDDAYAWAKTRVFREDDTGANCALVVENVDELESQIRDARNTGGASLFHQVSDEDLYAIGAPREVIPLLREIRTIEVLGALKGAVAPHVLYALECLARGDDKSAVVEYVTEESQRLAADSVTLRDDSAVERASTRFTLRDILERLMNVEAKPAPGTDVDEPERQAKSSVQGHVRENSAVAAASASPTCAHPAGDPIFEDAIQQYRVALLAWIAKKAENRERVVLIGSASKNSTMGAGDLDVAPPQGGVVQMLRDFVGGSKCVLVTSEGGSGKSTTMQMVAASWAQDYAPGKPVYLYVPLRDFRRETSVDIVTFVCSPEAGSDGAPVLSREVVERLKNTHRLVLLLDGSDEIEPGSRPSFTRLLTTGKRQKHFSAVVVSSRESSAPREIFDWTVGLQRLEEGQQLEVVRSYLPEKERAEQFLAELRSEPGGREISDNPLCLSLACTLEASGGGTRTRKLGWVGRAHLYRQFWDCLQEREQDKLRDDFGNRTGLQYRVALGAAFANALIDQRKRQLDRQIEDVGGGVLRQLVAREPLVAQMILENDWGSAAGAKAANPTVPDVMAGLRGLCPSPEEVCGVMLQWPMFELKGNNCFTSRHKTWHEFLIAEYLLASPESGEAVAMVVTQEDRFLLRCVFELAADGYWRDSGPNASLLLKALHRIDPLYAAMSVRGDGSEDALKQCVARDRSPLADDPWRRGVQEAMAGLSVRASTDRIVEQDLSFPSRELAKDLANPEFWWAANCYRDVYQRVENLWHLCHTEPEPWADILRYCVAGFPDWRHRVGDLAANDPDDAVRAKFQCLSHLLRIGVPTGVASPPVFDDDGDAGGMKDGLPWALAAPRLLLNCCLADCSPYLELCPDVALVDGASHVSGSEVTVPILFSVQHVIWALCRRPEMWCEFGGEGFSRRQWQLVWRLWDANDPRAAMLGLEKAVAAKDVAAGAAILRSVLPAEMLQDRRWENANEAAALIRLGVVHVELISPEAVGRWARSGTAMECRALMIAGVPLDRYETERALFLRLAIDVAGRRFLQAYVPDDVGEFLSFWCGRGCSIDWLEQSLIAGILDPVFNSDLFCYWQWDLFEEECICWDHLSIRCRMDICLTGIRRLFSENEYLPPYTVVSQLDSSQEVSISPHIPPCSAVPDQWAAVFFALQLIKAIGGGRVRWQELQGCELALLTRSRVKSVLEQCISSSILPVDVLADAPEVIRRLGVVASALERWESIEGDRNERRKEALGLVVLQTQDPLKGGLSGSQVTRVFYRHPDEVLQIGVLKTTLAEQDFRREAAGASLACSSWMAESPQGWIPPNPHRGEISLEIKCEPAEDGQSHALGSLTEYLLLSPLAFPPTAGSLQVSSLHELVERREASAASAVVSHLGAAYSCRLRKRLERGGDGCVAMSFREHVKTLLGGRWPKLFRDGEIAGEPSAFLQRMIGCPAIIDLDGKARRNPLLFLTGSDSGGSAVDLLPMDFCHGDLNARNILVPAAPQSTAPLLQMIDFEKAGEYIASLDPCWLSFWLVMASEPHPNMAAPLWKRLPESILAAASGAPQVPEDCGGYQLGLDLVRMLFRSWWVLDEANATALGPLAERTMLAGLLGCAVAKSLLHDRDIERRRTRGEQDSSADAVDGAWRVTFIRLAALALERAVGAPSILEPSVTIASLVGDAQ